MRATCDGCAYLPVQRCPCEWIAGQGPASHSMKELSLLCTCSEAGFYRKSRVGVSTNLLSAGGNWCPDVGCKGLARAQTRPIGWSVHGSGRTLNQCSVSALSASSCVRRAAAGGACWRALCGGH
eukprot:scaffold80891_cov19-Tisochrysis_lutea.AAC.4